MSRTLSFAHHLLMMGQRHQNLGRHREASRFLGRLANIGELQPEIAEEAAIRLAEISLARRQYKKNQRQVQAALALAPKSARLHHLAAQCHMERRDGDLESAASHLRQALEADRNNPAYLANLGLVTIALGDKARGVRRLYNAVKLAPDDPIILERLIDGLVQIRRRDEARQALLAARFRHPRDPRFLQLWNDFQFQTLHERQASRRRASESQQSDGPTILPFSLARRDRTESATAKILRFDAPEQPSGPHVRERLHPFSRPLVDQHNGSNESVP